MSGAINYFLSWRERQQARQSHDPLENEEEQGDVPLQEDPSRSQQADAENANSDNNTTITVETVTEDDDEDDVENQRSSGITTEGDTPETPTFTPALRPSRRTVTLADLEEEREASRRRTSVCVLLAVFILFRLWMQALVTQDFFLLMMCMVGTSWTARFIRHTREREEELDRLIAEYVENPDGNAEVNRSDVRMLSFQAQLALAIMESQRQMMEGGFGNPDGHSSSTPGVSDGARERWYRFDFKSKFDKKFKDGYGAVAQDATDRKDDDSEEEPHCSICLCEYEKGDKLVCLPCEHVFHEDCVSSWTSNHIRCPLCNFDLESVTEDNQEVV